MRNVGIGLARGKGMSKAVAWSVGILVWLLASTAVHAGERHYYYTDPQGTVLVKADAAGNIIETSDYRPYGARALGTTADGPGYTGHVNDADSGLVYMQARYYDPTMGRFLSVDPIGIGDENSFNRYWYANGNPGLYTDPDGRMSRPGEERPCYGSQLECAEQRAELSSNFWLSASQSTDAEQASPSTQQCNASECEEYRELNGNILRMQGATLVEAGKFAGKEAGWLALTDIGGRALGRLFGGVLRLFRVSPEAAQIASGHAFAKHVGEFAGLGIKTERQFARHIDSVLANPSAVRTLNRGRTAYWDAQSGTLVIRDPGSIDGGTAFIPTQGVTYFNNLR